MKLKEQQMYMDTALRAAQMSHAVRLKVGAVIARPSGNFVSYGYNGMPADMPNCCEHEVDGQMVTNKEVLHAEANAILKAAREGRSTDGAWIFITHSPCVSCATFIKQAGISHVVYHQDYRCSAGVEFLRSHGIEVIKFQHEEV